jgi:autophagy-related protein 13
MLDETDVLSDDLQEWKRSDLSDEPPPPLVIEVYVDTSHLTQNQSLVIVDDAGRRWDVADSVAAESSPKSNRAGGRYYEVLLERWTIEMGDMSRYKASQLNDQLPNVYKKGVLLFRSLYTFARFLPAWKLHKRLSRQPSNAQPLKLRYRIRQGRPATNRLSKDALQTPLCPSDLNNTTIAEHHDFAPLLCSAGPLTISIDYRTNADLTVADAEALLSSRFAGLDAGLANRYPAGGRSLPGGHHHSVAPEDSSASLGPTSGGGRPGARVAGGGAYGSLGTFHAAGKRESPVSALRNRAISGASDTPPSPERRVTPQSIPTSSAGMDYLKNPPFKAGSVASSPRTTAASPSPSTSAPRPSTLTGTSAHSKRLSLNTLPQQALRNPGGITQDTAIASSGSTSPKPAPVHRYSSSFAGRKRWTSTSQSSRAGESATSSGRGSSSSKEKSGQLAPEHASGTPGSSGSARTDEDDIAAFISTVERAKDLKAFSTRKPAPHNNVINLSRFKNMSLASSELADEMSSSSLVQTSLTPPSRRLSNVPGLSTSSSPSRMQPHAPHVRSRLSTQSIAEEIGSEKGRKPEREVEEEDEEVNEDDSDDDEPFIFQQDNIL